MIFRATAHIDHNALLHNFQRAKQFAPQSKIVAVIKANAYGHGALATARTLKDADALGVAGIEEALQLRQNGIRQPILLMSGFFDSSVLPLLIQENIWSVLYEEWQIAALEQASLAQPLTVWLKIDTGMHRLGFPLTEVQSIYQRLLSCPHVKKPIVAMTHLADSDILDSSLTERQLRYFQEVTSTWDCPKSAANSGGILCWPTSHFDWIRPGVMLYGATSIANKIGRHFNLRPVMALTSRLISKRYCYQNEPIGYGGIWKCPEDMWIGVVSVGYGDGYPRHAKTGTPVLINNIVCPLIARVSMDLITVDLRANPEAKIGEEAYLWGEKLPAEHIAHYADTIALQLFCNIMNRVHFHDDIE